jgi:hypothetical protein
VPLVGQREAAGMPQHMRMGLEAELGGQRPLFSAAVQPYCRILPLL